MAASLKNVRAITLFVDDPKRSKSFYESVFDALPVREDDDSVAFQLENTIVNLLKVAAAPELIAPAAVADPSAGSRFQLTIRVDDVDAACAALAGRGIALLNGPIDREWGVRTAAFADADGHVWELAQQLAAPTPASV